VLRWTTLVMKYILGSTFEQGLADLKTVVEKGGK